MNRDVRLLKSSIREETMDEVLAADKVLELHYRHPSSWVPQNILGEMRNFVSAYFVLEDKLRAGLEGTIILNEEHSAEHYFTYSVWEITKGIFG